MNTSSIPHTSEVYSTADMYLAAALLAEGFELLRTNRKDPNHIHFEFKNFRDDGKETCELEDTVSLYINNNLSINVADFVDGLRKVKSLIYAR